MSKGTKQSRMSDFITVFLFQKKIFTLHTASPVSNDVIAGVVRKRATAQRK